VQGLAYRLSLRMLGAAQDAEDATQEILVLVVTHLSQFDGRSRFTTWVYAIASRHLLRARRSRMEERAVAIGDVANAIELGLAHSDPASLPVGDVRLLARDVQRTCTQAMLLCLSREERLAVLLGDMLGASDAVGAELCEVSRDAFRQRLSRGRATLRPLLEERCGIENPERPCRCTRQAAAKQRAGLKLPVYRDAEEDVSLARAEDQLGSVARLGHVLAVEPPPMPRPELWSEIARRIPDLLR
jgi:RNA polymerase sigma factor (sigma-70 family)